MDGCLVARYISLVQDRQDVLLRSFCFFLGDVLLDEVVSGSHGVRATRNRHNSVSSSRCEDTFLRDLDRGAGETLDFDEMFATGSENRPDDVLTDLDVFLDGFDVLLRAEISARGGRVPQRATEWCRRAWSTSGRAQSK